MPATTGTLCIGAHWIDGRIELQLENGTKQILVAGVSLALAVSRDRTCIGWLHPQTHKRVGCPERATPRSGSQCESCQRREHLTACHRCTGMRCGNPLRRPSCIQPQNHACYLVSFAPNVIKVGVAARARVEQRIGEQGARAAIVIAYADGREARNLEWHIRGRTRRPDRLSLAIKLSCWSQPANRVSLSIELERAADEIRRRLAGPWLRPPRRLRTSDVPLLESQPRLLTHLGGQGVRGEVKSLLGNVLVVASDGGEEFAFDARSLAGHSLRPLRDGDPCGVQQLALALR